ncbi:hypothetical protein RB595_003271 [Gaeumannomyces hyphopodioides]
MRSLWLPSILAREADIQACSRERQNPLHLAVEHAQAVTLLLDKGAAINNKDALGQTPLNLAVRRRHIESAMALIRREADRDVQDDRGMTPLSYAIEQNDLAMVEAFFEASPGTFRNNMWDNLKRAVQCSAASVARFIISRPPDAINEANDQMNELFFATAKQDLADILLALADLGADIKRRWDPHNQTALHAAAESGRVENMRGLMELGAEVDAADVDDKTPLHYAAKSGHAEAISTLLDQGASINAVNKQHETPLFCAAYGGHVGAAKALLNGGSDVTLCRTDGWSPLHAAADNVEMSALLILHESDVNLPEDTGSSPMHFAVRWDHSETVQLLLENGGDPNMADHDETTPFHRALLLPNRYECARAILGHGGSNMPGLDTPTWHGLAPIHMAILSDSNPDLTRLLLGRGAKAQVRAVRGATCLSLAVTVGQGQVLEILLEGAPCAGSWDYRDLVAAYWQGILMALPGSASARCVERLLDTKEGGRLLKELSDEGGHSGLKAYLLRAQNINEASERKLLPLALLNRGIDPFEPRSLGQETAFELGIRTWGSDINDFIEACAKYIPHPLVPSPNFGFRELRMVTELDTASLWKKLEPLLKHVETEADQDGWTICHFLSQSAPRLEFTPHEVPKTWELKTPTAVVWPSTWKVEYLEFGPGVEISADGRGVWFEGRNHSGGEKGMLSVRADFPSPHRNTPLGLPYFEVTIEQAPGAIGPESDGDGLNPTVVSVGFCGELVDLRDRHPGRIPWTVAYHGDNGGIYEEHARTKYPTERLFGPGSTVGCGIDYHKGEYLFTLDGEVVARHSSKVIYRKLYPCIGHSDGAASVTVNFGASDFVWKEAGQLRAREADGSLRAAAGRERKW